MSLPKNSIQILNNIFLINRVINPKTKEIINLNNIDINSFKNHQCFDFWENGISCSNCISMRALNENNSFSKFETLNDKVYMVIASPININGVSYVVELLKDVTDDTLLYDLQGSALEDLKSEVSRLNKLIVTDELTNIFNIRYLNETLPTMLSNLNKSNNSINIIIIDIDKFKLINDSYGHLCGDYIIKEFANLLDSYIHSIGGFTCRYGGDEFVSVVENLTEDDTYIKVEEFEEIINNHNFVYANKKITISFSFGISYLSSNDISITDALNLADLNLYTLKKSKCNN